MDDPIVIRSGLTIPLAEIELTTSRSGGPGGQHVNTSSTRVQLAFDVSASPSLSEPQRRRIREALATRIDTRGRLRLACQTHRSQAKNREEAVERLRALLSEALRPRKRRVKTRPTAGSRERRLVTKRRQAEAKTHRRGPTSE